MRKFTLFVLSALLVLGLSAQVRAEMSPSSATGTSYRDNQVFTVAYNNSGSDITSNAVVIIDTSGTAGSTLGAYITTTATADHTLVFGVTDETITSGTSGRVCIRGPHKVWLTAAGANSMAANDIVSTSTTAGRGTEYSTSDATVGGYLGRALAVTGATETTFGSVDGSDIWWVWVSPQVHK